ncbi:uncharacterized protein BDZ99DRAFT_114014 [Mytilinidion resinicola]|uniref:PRELI/MSF1 domain-containing protein n=1 Tax=Mytilinidion resinicola TaxID=574789 RepID=A0A6A6Y8H8_9PEZI|nr:uncharacterized protein BDZ99DRAFT_114014 [Mytilinidion resinicola]KAF2805146.1 hypothetical protein BDZ99DRAFT_114014 [Mytilinidion resinicola]
MVKFYSSTYDYSYPFPAVTLAYFLRYPNPYSTHVLSTDTISRSFDPATQRLTTVRLHLKRSKLPSAVLKLLPRSLLGASAAGDSQSYILETSTVDVKEGVMHAESRNLEWTGVLSVVEKQTFRRPASPPDDQAFKSCEGAAEKHGFLEKGEAAGRTDVQSTVILLSRLGQWKKRRAAAGIHSEQDAAAAGKAVVEEEAEQPQKVGFFKSWSTASLQRSIELIGLKRARRSQPNAMEGMKVVLERMREGGLVGVLEGMRRDREMVTHGHHGAGFKKVENESGQAIEDLGDHHED